MFFIRNFTMQMKVRCLGTFLIVGSLIVSCGYSPSQFVSEGEGTDPTTESQTISTGTVYQINTEGTVRQQICNASISQDPVNFPGAMLWLGFTKLSVKNPPAGYTLTNIVQHDRLTITNYKNEVVWYLMRDDVADFECEFQDPEWAAHPHYVTALGKHKTNGEYCDEYGDHSGFAVRLADKKAFMFNERKLHNTATPHIWIDPAVTAANGGTPVNVTYDADGFADAQSVKDFFGTQNVKIAWAEKSEGVLTIKWADYSSGSVVLKTLQKPDGKSNWNAESPLFSPDGNFITFNLFQSIFLYEAWVQKLDSDGKSLPEMISESGMDPRWWKNPFDNKLYITYVKRPAGEQYVIVDKLEDPALAADGSSGGTYMKLFDVTSTTPKAFWNIGKEKIIASLPFKGGVSPDGKFMCTGTNYAYMLELN